MIYLLLGIICGIVIGQEVDSIPKLKPHLQRMYAKLFDNNPPASGEEEKND